MTYAFPTRNKFNARRTIYKGAVFDSQKEAGYAQHLDTLKRAKLDQLRVVKVDYQVPFELFIKKKLIFTYYLDFKVEYADGRIEYVDIKGLRKGAAYQIFKIKKKAIEAEYGISISEI